MKYLSIDLETTGLDPTCDQILEIAAVYETDDGRPVANLPRFRQVIKHDRLHGSPIALSMNAQLLIAEDACDQFKAEALFADFLDRACGGGRLTVAGKNVAGFDIPFIRATFPSLYPSFHHRTIDPTIMFWIDTDTQLPDLKTCLTRAGLPIRPSHNALNDAISIIQLCRSAGFAKGSPT